MSTHSYRHHLCQLAEAISLTGITYREPGAHCSVPGVSHQFGKCLFRVTRMVEAPSRQLSWFLRVFFALYFCFSRLRDS